MDISFFTRQSFGSVSRFGPERPAVGLDDDAPLTHGELSGRSRAYANALREMGVRHGDRVALLLYDSAEYWVAYFAITRLGAIAVRLNFRLGPDELEYALTDSGATVVLGDPDLLERLSDRRGRLALRHAISTGEMPDWALPWAVLEEGASSDPDVPLRTPTIRTLAVNLTGTMLTVRAFRPVMRADGSIVTMGSVAALRAMPLADAYTASKGAIVALTRSWAVDYGRDGIRVNCVCPGPTDTDMMSGMREGFAGDRQVQLPQQRMASGEEVAALIAFLLSPASGYLSGAIIPVDGGATAHSAGMPFPRRRVASA